MDNVIIIVHSFNIIRTTINSAAAYFMRGGLGGNAGADISLLGGGTGLV